MWHRLHLKSCYLGFFVIGRVYFRSRKIVTFERVEEYSGVQASGDIYPSFESFVFHFPLEVCIALSRSLSSTDSFRPQTSELKQAERLFFSKTDATRIPVWPGPIYYRPGCNTPRCSVFLQELSASHRGEIV